MGGHSSHTKVDTPSGHFFRRTGSGYPSWLNRRATPPLAEPIPSQRRRLIGLNIRLGGGDQDARSRPCGGRQAGAGVRRRRAREGLKAEGRPLQARFRKPSLANGQNTPKISL